MCAASPFSETNAYAPRDVLEYHGQRLPACFADLSAEYRAARQGAVVFDRTDRGLLEVAGQDRATWLHNLVTNTVRTLEPHDGVYAFATNAKGRILFDLHALCRDEVLWLDLDIGALAPAATHFDRHLFTEDVKIRDISGQYARLACSGPRCAAVAAALGVGNFAALAALQSVTLAEDDAQLVRHDFAGATGFELIVPRGVAAKWWERVRAAGAEPAGRQTLDVLRIEAGIPWWGRDFDETVLPPETGQIERGISYQKGCYIGQEIMERMRTRGALARRLVQLRVGEGAGLVPPVALERDGQELGRITSLVKHPVESHWLGLGYLKTSVTGFAEITAGDPPRAIIICSA